MKEDRAWVNSCEAMEEYLRRQDWRIQENANQSYSLGGLMQGIAGKLTANYWLEKIYPESISKLHRAADLHLHDLGMFCGYCAGWSLRQLLREGFNGIAGAVEATPPRHLRSAVGQMINFLGSLQNEWAGAQSFSSVDTYLAPYIRRDNLSYSEVKQNMQELVYNLNVLSRWGSQAPFTNFTFDWNCPDDLKHEEVQIAGEPQNFCYGNLGEEISMMNRAFIEVMCEGDAKGRIFTFPIPTYNITDDFDWEAENVDILFEATAKYGLPYFQNFLNSDISPSDVRSMCCRLRLDLRELRRRGAGLFGSAEQTGSLGVVTLNCARLGYLAASEARLFRRLDYLLEQARDSLEIKRRVISHYWDKGLFPYTRRYLRNLDGHFSTIGVNGINEMLCNFFTGSGASIATAKGKALAEKFLDYIANRLQDFQEQTGNMYNLEASPAEGVTYRFARKDQDLYPSIIQAGYAEAPYYTNSSQLPVGFSANPLEALDHQESLQRKYTGGTVMHLYMNERISSAKLCQKLVRRV
ncbi:MAG: ribonucleoside triphosphate reductase, partial [Spirochaetota bacterium]